MWTSVMEILRSQMLQWEYVSLQMKLIYSKSNFKEKMY